jgi:hypothetical protein
MWFDDVIGEPPQDLMNLIGEALTVILRISTVLMISYFDNFQPLNDFIFRQFS